MIKNGNCMNIKNFHFHFHFLLNTALNPDEKGNLVRKELSFVDESTMTQIQTEIFKKAKNPFSNSKSCQ